MVDPSTRRQVAESYCSWGALLGLATARNVEKGAQRAGENDQCDKRHFSTVAPGDQGMSMTTKARDRPVGTDRVVMMPSIIASFAACFLCAEHGPAG